MFEFKLPDLGEGIHEGEVLKWHVSPGDPIREDDPLVDVETDKAAVTIPSPRSGRVASVKGRPGDTVRVGDVIAVIDESGAGVSEGGTTPSLETQVAAAPKRDPARPEVPEEPERPSPEPEASPRRTGPRAVTMPPAQPATAAQAGRPIPAAPATRRVARELGVVLAQVPASGPAGRVTTDDVRRFAERGGRPSRAAAAAYEPEAAAVPESVPVPVHEPEPRPDQTPRLRPGASPIPFLDLEPLPDFSQWGEVEREPLRSVRRRTAHRMVTSMTLVPHVAHMDEADVTDLEELRRREKERRDVPLTLLAFVVKAVLKGLREHPILNASLDPFAEEIVYKKFYNVGFAADTGRGLIVPVLRDADRLSIVEISKEIRRLAEKTRDGKAEPGDLRGGTFTITNIGPLGGTGLVPAINYPEVAILGMGRAAPKPVVREGRVEVRTVLPLTLSFDHRVADGADAARFVGGIVRRLSDPYSLLLEG
ncbi:MAG: 2-oxo acid dehydrogenase subunit E2 [Deltaproteobacteria bacterium]|nr:2-oxo acid dehydrogenase subunit E2 [Deltaproteobacteria bacterium]